MLATELPDTFRWSTVSPGYDNYGLQTGEAIFLRTVIDAYNKHNDYPLELPMSKHLASQRDDVDVLRLEEEGFIKRHQLMRKGEWYTPTPKAQNAVDQTLKSGPWTGDIGEDIPHRVLIVLAERYFQSLSEVHLVNLYMPIGSGDDIYAATGRGDNEGVADVVAVDEDHNPVHVAEIEAGDKSEAGRWGTNNAQSVVKDYQQLASMTGQKWWIVRNRSVGERILNHLINKNMLPFKSFPSGGINRKRKKLAQFSESIDGMDHMYSASELYSALSAGEVLTDE
jgi:hypothetical protein